LDILSKLDTLVTELKNTSSRNDKISILKANEWCKPIFKIVYDPYSQHGVTSANCKKLSHLVGHKTDNVFDLVAAVKAHSGHDSIKHVNQFILDFGYEELVYSIIDKNLKCRTDAKVINLAFPGLIPTFNVALAKNYADFTDYVDSSWLYSRKLDGCRLIARRSDETPAGVTYWSRQGKPFTTLSGLSDRILELPSGYVLDGEVCVMRGDNEDFQDTMKVIRKKDYTIESPKFYVFDILTNEEFDSGKSKLTLLQRLDRFELSSGNVVKLEQSRIKDKDLSNYPKEWEGLILRKDCPYEGKRTKNLLKVKKFDDAEYVVKDIATGPFQIIEDGKEVEIETMTKVTIDHKGFEVSVGSGWNLEQRRHYYENPSDIIGRTITVQYFGQSENAKGGLSLRFPTVKAVHGNIRTT
jgi:DNA ligase 1